MLDIFEAFIGDLTGVTPDLAITCATVLAVFILDCCFRVILMAFRAMFGLK